MKKFLAIILAAVMLLSIGCVAFAADETETEETKVTNWVEVTDPTDNWTETPTEPTTLFTPEQYETLSEMVDDVMTVVNGSSSILQILNSWLQAIIDFFNNIADEIANLTVGGRPIFGTK